MELQWLSFPLEYEYCRFESGTWGHTTSPFCDKRLINRCQTLAIVKTVNPIDFIVELENENQNY